MTANLYRGFGLERLFRDIQPARCHPLPEGTRRSLPTSIYCGT